MLGTFIEETYMYVVYRKGYLFFLEWIKKLHALQLIVCSKNSKTSFYLTWDSLSFNVKRLTNTIFIVTTESCTIGMPF